VSLLEAYKAIPKDMYIHGPITFDIKGIDICEDCSCESDIISGDLVQTIIFNSDIPDPFTIWWTLECAVHPSAAVAYDVCVIKYGGWFVSSNDGNRIVLVRHGYGG